MTAAENAIRSLLEERAAGRTICPSEAARKLAGANPDWRQHMDDVHRAVDTLIAADEVVISWKGERKEQRRGPYRIARR
ncbi:DUF3253 domain-containing protein [Erythrobacter rubeus]|uniref:DUF3253 domain-containing protein n=1 Tax=Erythrobacter rubeus TaxID=2760803 RepID=A0ABR8KR37_9SPHN|nr:DUF3253 domain-containing protein [Erythrobacter rubeus]MBD2840904.1 DUF3253 domain-containing protein [Erythrobacter rubeus]